MFGTGTLALAANRWTPFVHTIAFLGYDLTGADFAMQIRDYRDGGAERADLATVGGVGIEGITLVYAGTATVAVHIAAGRLEAIPDGYAEDDDLTLTLLSIRLNEPTVEGMPFAGVDGEGEVGEDLDLYWDLLITPAGGVKFRALEGVFTIKAGVTQ